MIDGSELQRWREEGDISKGDTGEEGTQKSKESQEVPEELQVRK